MITCISTSNKIPKHCIFAEFFLTGKSTRCSTKRAAHCSFRRALSNKYFEKVLLIHFASTWINLLDHCISAEFLLMEGYVQGALRRELLITSFVECSKATTLGRPHGQR